MDQGQDVNKEAKRLENQEQNHRAGRERAITDQDKKKAHISHYVLKGKHREGWTQILRSSTSTRFQQALL